MSILVSGGNVVCFCGFVQTVWSLVVYLDFLTVQTVWSLVFYLDFLTVQTVWFLVFYLDILTVQTVWSLVFYLDEPKFGMGAKIALRVPSITPAEPSFAIK